MKMFKNILIGLVIGLLIGLWFGINIGRDKPLFSNPFDHQPLHKELMRSGGELLEKSGQAIKNKMQDN